MLLLNFFLLIIYLGQFLIKRFQTLPVFCFALIIVSSVLNKLYKPIQFFSQLKRFTILFD